MKEDNVIFHMTESESVCDCNVFPTCSLENSLSRVCVHATTRVCVHTSVCVCVCVFEGLL